LVGVNTDYKLIENNGLDIQYFFDNDDAGFSKSEEKIKVEYPVFLWRKLFEDIVEKKNVADPAALLHRISKVKDINKLATLVQNPYKSLNLPDFFSKDVLDLKWIPKKKKYSKKEDTDYNKKFDNIKYL
jgi:nucleosome binding factor SPN SPT16 subunit